MAKQPITDRNGDASTAAEGSKHPMASKGPNTPGASTDDALAFRAAVSDVKPLAHTPLATGLGRPRAKARLRKAAALPDSLDEAMPLIHAPLEHRGGLGEEALAGNDAVSFQRAGVRTQVVRRLRRGLIPIEDELDLHGLSQSAARDHLAHFLANSRTYGKRCVRIIHGKGYRSGARGPVLKVAADSWLRRHPDVLAFTSARAIDGGTGAVYVLLRG
ncbi:MAG: Smr/MutS family protein [Pseudomonadota bacterium]|nr:Smr/MutS family protein [Pseudomonadota bacterium]